VLWPSEEREFTGAVAVTVMASLASAFKPFVDNGELVVDGKRQDLATAASNHAH